VLEITPNLVQVLGSLSLAALKIQMHLGVTQARGKYLKLNVMRVF
jgi:hypothetical protein